MKKSPRRISKDGHRYNWQPDLPDHRDYLYAEALPSRVVRAPRLPRSVDLRERCSPVFNQGKIGSCTGNALAGALEFLQLKQLREDDGGPEPEVFDPDQFQALSRLFIYYNERLLEGNTRQDSGASLRDGIRTLTQWGACREKIWAYLQTNLFKKPSAVAYSEASRHTILSYLRIEKLQEMKQCLSTGFPFVFGFMVYESFESPAVAKTGRMPLPRPGESAVGGHAVMAVGYDDAAKHLIVRNSWGEAWGAGGYFFMPYDYIERLGLAQDFWTIRR